MTYAWLAVWSVLGLAVSADAAESRRVESRIGAVTVFPDRAGITRTTSLNLSAGSQTIEFAPLPSHVEPASVTAKGSGKAEVTLYGVRLVTKQLETAQDPKVKSIEEAIRNVGRRQQQLRDVKQVLEKERKYLASIQAASSEQIGKDLITKSPSAEDAEKLLAFLDGALLKNFERDQEADEKLEELTRELDRLQRELAQLTQGRYKQETAILVDLDVTDDGSFELEVSYRVPGATWSPAYEARATTGVEAVDLSTSALVRQQTGEDWGGVQLTLSTAKPAVAGSMPELEPWFLRPWEPVYRGAELDKLEMPATKGSRLKAYSTVGDAAAPPAQERELQEGFATVDTQGPAVTFRLPRAASIPSDWQPHKVPIASQQFAASVAYEATPKSMPYAFLRAKVTNVTDSMYLAGPVSVFLDGAFIATASLKQIAPKEEFDLYLGVDERVKVERKQLKAHEEVSLLPGLRGKTKSTDYEFLTTIENFTGRKISVTVFDQLPVSEREEIVVEAIRQLPREVEKDKEKPGVFRWALDLGPNQRQELTLAYRIRHPVDLQVQ